MAGYNGQNGGPVVPGRPELQNKGERPPKKFNVKLIPAALAILTLVVCLIIFSWTFNGESILPERQVPLPEAQALQQEESQEAESVPDTDSFVFLSDLECSDQSDKINAFEYYGTVRDNLGTVYANGLGGTESGEKSWKEYILDGTYSELRGRVVLDNESKTKTNDGVYLWIYGDNIALYQSEEVKAGVLPQDFTVDLTGITRLKVAIQGRNMLRLVDCGLYRDSSVPTVSTAIAEELPDVARIYLKDVEWNDASSSDGGFEYYGHVKDNFGTDYSNGFGGTDSGTECWQEYLLNGDYSEIRGRVVLNYDERTKTTQGVYLWIYGDDNLLYQSEEVTAGAPPQDFTVDLTGVKRLKVAIQGRNMLRLVDCALYMDSSVPTASSAETEELPDQQRIYLSDLDWFNGSDASGSFAYYDAVKDNEGTTYPNGIGGTDSSGQSFQEYRLDGAYSKMTGRVVLEQESAEKTNEGVCLWVYGDGELLYQSEEVRAGVAPQDFSVDLSGVENLKVVIQGRSMLRLVDCILYK